MYRLYLRGRGRRGFKRIESGGPTENCDEWRKNQVVINVFFLFCVFVKSNKNKKRRKEKVRFGSAREYRAALEDYSSVQFPIRPSLRVDEDGT